ncbi:MAG: hypothetical protein CM1200mP22_06600 [Dehalococcoidia bacterium]|nr:MAG: hypothetical protein CM1200mP22_06600 [Dehalococcoidia bacterium]
MANKEEIADVLVIGAGASGSAFTWSLAKAGIKVVCLEQGGWVQPMRFLSPKLMPKSIGRQISTQTQASVDCQRIIR